MALFQQQRYWERLVMCHYKIGAVTDNFDQRLRHYNRALALAESHLGKDHDDTERALYRLASHYSYFGDYDRTLALARRALDIQLANHGEVNPQIFGYLRLIAHVYRKLGEFDTAFKRRLR